MTAIGRDRTHKYPVNSSHEGAVEKSIAVNAFNVVLLTSPNYVKLKY